VGSIDHAIDNILLRHESLKACVAALSVAALGSTGEIAMNLDKLEAQAAKVAPLPWIVRGPRGVTGREIAPWGEGRLSDYWVAEGGSPEDAAYLCALGNAAPALFAAVRERDALRAEVESLRSEINACTARADEPCPPV